MCEYLMNDAHCDAKTAHCNKIISQIIKLDLGVAGWSRRALPIPSEQVSNNVQQQGTRNVFIQWLKAGIGQIMAISFRTDSSDLLLGVIKVFGLVDDSEQCAVSITAISCQNCRPSAPLGFESLYQH